MADQQELNPHVPGAESTSAQSGPASTVAEGKGKEKQPIQDVSMGEEDSDEDEDDSGAENAEPEPEEEDEDNMEEIDTDNIVSSRTRGKSIDFAQANADAGLPDDSDDEDDDFQGDEDDAMQDRFAPPTSSSSSTLHQRDPRSTLFDAYTGDRNRTSSHSPAAAAGRQGYSYAAGGGGGGGGGGGSSGAGGYRSATPNSRGQYSDAVLSELENQNDAQIEGMSAKVKMLKDITSAIGVEIRDSSQLAESMNDGFETTRVRLKGTMKRMLRMAERTGVGWKVWVLFFLAVWGVFGYVWLF